MEEEITWSYSGLSLTRGVGVALSDLVDGRTCSKILEEVDRLTRARGWPRPSR